MPSFFSKILQRKKPEQASTPSNGTFEHSSTNLLGHTLGKVTRSLSSPSAPAPDKRTLRPKSPTKHSASATTSVGDAAPLLSLTLPEPKLDEETKSTGIVFESGSEVVVVDEQVIKDKRLSPQESLLLVQECSKVILERGLETLGLFKPYWHSSSPQSQQKLISLFLASPSSSTFQSELEYARSPHDIASVLKWGLRHLKLDSSFGNQSKKDSDEWAWYRQFSTTEQQQSYPSSAFTTILLPILPSSHANLLKVTLDLVSSVAAHADANAMSGSKLSKVLGWWVISSRKVQWKGWEEFYAEWEKAARVFEHLFLAFVRDQAQDAKKLPVRLLELIRHYPYTKTPMPAETPEPYFLSKPRFTSRTYPAVLIRVKTEVAGKPTSLHPIQVVKAALTAQFEEGNGGEYGAFWTDLKKRAIETGEDDVEVNGEVKKEEKESEKEITLNRILADETVRILSSVPLTPTSGATLTVPASPTISVLTTNSERRYPYRRRSFSLSDTPLGALMEDGDGAQDIIIKDATRSVLAFPSSTSSTENTDWNMFSSEGFGESGNSLGSGLAASLVKVDSNSTTPRKSLAQRPTTPSKTRKSFQVDSGAASSTKAPTPLSPIPATPSVLPKPIISPSPTLIQLDEAFVDFWSDSLLDPALTNAWPSFVVCQLKSPTSPSSNPIEWVVIEHSLVAPPPPPSPAHQAFPRATSPSPSQMSSISPSKLRFGRRISSSSTATTGRKRFGLFGNADTGSVRKISFGKRPTVGDVSELGEKIVKEETVNGNGKDKTTTGKPLLVVPILPPPQEEKKTEAPVPAPAPPSEIIGGEDTVILSSGLEVVPVLAETVPQEAPAPSAESVELSPVAPAEEAEKTIDEIPAKPEIPPVVEDVVPEEAVSDETTPAVGVVSELVQNGNVKAPAVEQITERDVIPTTKHSNTEPQAENGSHPVETLSKVEEVESEVPPNENTDVSQ